MNEVMYKNVDYLIEHGVNVKKSLELFGDIDTYNDTLQDFYDGIFAKLEKLSRFKANVDIANYAIFAHSIKSDARYLGFEVLYEIAYSHELRAKEKDVDFVNANYDKLVEETNKVIEIVKNYLGK